MTRKQYVDIDMQGRRVKNPGGLGRLNVLDYGALGDGSTDDTTAITAAITALPAAGGFIMFPGGYTFKCASTLDFSSRRNVMLIGSGGRSAGAATASVITFSGTGSGNFINASASAGFGMRDLMVLHTSGSFTGRLINLEGGASDTSFVKIQNCLIGGSGVRTATLIYMNKVISSAIVGCHLTNGNIGIYGKASGAYSNSIHIDDCMFTGMNTISMRNPGQAWTVTNCTFENLNGGTAGAIDHESTVQCEALLVQGCWTGDSTGGTQFLVAGKAISIRSNYIGCTSGIGVKTDEITNGINIEDNEFAGATTAIDIFTSGSNSGQRIFGNYYNSVTNRIAAGTTLSGGAIYQDGTSAGVRLYGASFSGDITGNVNFDTAAIVSFNSDTNLFRLSAGLLGTTRGGASLTLGIQAKVDQRTTDTSTINSTTLVTVCTLTLEADTYYINFQGSVIGNATTSTPAINLQGTAVTSAYRWRAYMNSATAAANVSAVSSGTTLPGTTSGVALGAIGVITTDNEVVLSGRVVVTTAGTVNIAMSRSAGTGTFVAKDGSIEYADRIA